MKILLDVDGVLADFHRAVCDALGLPGIRDKWPNGQFRLDTVLHLPDRDWWQAFYNYRPNGAWLYLKLMPHAKDIVSLVREYDPDFHFITNPSPEFADERTLKDKLSWINKYFGPHHRVMFTDQRVSFAKSGYVLIDDYEQQCLDYEAAGGQAIICPRPWNGQWAIEHNAVQTIRLQLEAIKEGTLEPRLIPPSSPKNSIPYPTRSVGFGHFPDRHREDRDRSTFIE